MGGREGLAEPAMSAAGSCWCQVMVVQADGHTADDLQSGVAGDHQNEDSQPVHLQI